MRSRGTGRKQLRPKFAAAAALAIAITAAAACGSDSGGGAGVLRYGYDFDAQFTGTFDTAKSTGDCDQVITNYIYDTLLHKTPGGELKPGLATEWTIPAAKKGTELDLTIRPNLTFTDGSPLDAEAVGQALIQNGKNPQLTSVALVKSYHVVDPTHIQLTLKNDQAIQVLYSFAGNRDGQIMAPASFATANDHPVGAGPFKLKSYTSGQEVVLEKNADYWDKDSYKDLDGITFSKVSTGPPSVTALKAGDVDMIRVETDTLAALKSDKDVKVAQQSTGAYLQFEFRLKNKDGSPTPFNNLKVRQAIEYAIDRKAVNDAAQDGLGELTDQPFPKGSPVHVEELDDYYTYNVDKAKQLLAEGGFPNGFSFGMVIPGGGIQNMESQAATIQQQLKKINVNAKVIRVLPSNIATGFYISGTGDAFAAEELASTFPGGSLYNNFGIGQYVSTYDHAENPQIDALMLKAQSTTDINETYTFVRQAVDIAVKQALDVPIAFAPQFNAYNASRVSGTVGAQTNICDPPDLTQVKVSG
jgi:peptide/nickel transport system substrate-binding protein